MEEHNDQREKTSFNPLIQVNDFYPSVAALNLERSRYGFNPLIQVNDFYHDAMVAILEEFNKKF